MLTEAERVATLAARTTEKEHKKRKARRMAGRREREVEGRVRAQARQRARQKQMDVERKAQQAQEQKDRARARKRRLTRGLMGHTEYSWYSDKATPLGHTAFSWPGGTKAGGPRRQKEHGAEGEELEQTQKPRGKGYFESKRQQQKRRRRLMKEVARKAELSSRGRHETAGYGGGQVAHKRRVVRRGKNKQTRTKRAKARATAVRRDAVEAALLGTGTEEGPEQRSILVRTLRGPTITVAYKETLTTSDIVEEVARREGIPEEELWLAHHLGRPLRPHLTLREMNIGANTTLTGMGRLQGGDPNDRDSYILWRVAVDAIGGDTNSAPNTDNMTREDVKPSMLQKAAMMSEALQECFGDNEVTLRREVGQLKERLLRALANGKLYTKTKTMRTVAQRKAMETEGGRLRGGVRGGTPDESPVESGG